MSKKTITSLIIASLMLSIVTALIYTNLDFETGDFTGWNFSLVSTPNVPPEVVYEDGSYVAFFNGSKIVNEVNENETHGAHDMGYVLSYIYQSMGDIDMTRFSVKCKGQKNADGGDMFVQWDGYEEISLDCNTTDWATLEYTGDWDGDILILYWGSEEGICYGTPENNTCDLLSEYWCNIIDGCVWDINWGCLGNHPNNCSDIPDISPCELVGCNWNFTGSSYYYLDNVAVCGDGVCSEYSENNINCFQDCKTPFVETLSDVGAGIGSFFNSAGVSLGGFVILILIGVGTAVILSKTSSSIMPK